MQLNNFKRIGAYLILIFLFFIYMISCKNNKSENEIKTISNKLEGNWIFCGYYRDNKLLNDTLDTWKIYDGNIVKSKGLIIQNQEGIKLLKALTDTTFEAIKIESNCIIRYEMHGDRGREYMYRLDFDKLSFNLNDKFLNSDSCKLKIDKGTIKILSYKMDTSFYSIISKLTNKELIFDFGSRKAIFKKY